MKKLLLFSVFALFLTSCQTMQDYSQTDVVQDGYRYKYGSSSGTKVGDKVTVYRKEPSTARKGFTFKQVGTMTVVKVENDHAIMIKDGDFEIDKSIAFRKD